MGATLGIVPRLERWVVGLTRTTAVLGLLLLTVLAVMTGVDGLLRWLANRPIDGVRDVGGLVIAAAVAACLPVALAERANITIRFVEPLLGRRASDLCDVLASLAVLVVVGLMAWQFQLFTDSLARSRQTTWVLQWPLAPFWQAVTVLIAMGVPVQAVIVASDLAKLAGRRPPDHERPAPV